MSVSITFLGAAGTVTGSKYLVRCSAGDLLVDCGLFQGDRRWRDRNWDTPPFDPARVRAVLLTHAHIDHTGMLPRMQRLGLRCPVYSTAATCDLTELLLLDSAQLQEEESEYREQTGKSRHHPALPLYTREDAQAVLQQLRTVPWKRPVEILPGVRAEWRRMGHILGAASITLQVEGKTLAFSGDVGRYGVPILQDPEPLGGADLLLIESTYGNRSHGEEPIQEQLASAISTTAKRGGVVLIPSFAVGRTQQLLFYLRELKEARRIPDLPIVIDSPMARDATEIYRKHPDCYDDESLGILKRGQHPFEPSALHFIRDREESKKLNRVVAPMVIISASGMLTGGRVLHHLFHRVSSPKNTILFVGFQPPGSRGAWMLSGATSLRVLHEEVPLRAEVREISGLSAHADRDELLRLASSCAAAPGRVAVVHGEPEAAQAFAKTLTAKLAWNVGIPAYQDTWTV